MNSAIIYWDGSNSLTGGQADLKDNNAITNNVPYELPFYFFPKAFYNIVFYNRRKRLLIEWMPGQVAQSDACPPVMRTVGGSILGTSIFLS